jgi:hypothetical protein
MLRSIGLLALVGGWMLCLPCLGQNNTNAAQENQQLRQRVETLEKQVQQLQATAQPAPGVEKAPAPELEPAKKPFWSTLDIQFYGYVKLDAAWDSSRVTTGNYILYGDRGGAGDDEFNLTAKQTRLGLKITGPTVGSMKTSGVVETDFYGSAGAENKANVLLRLAYMQLDWPDDKFSILAGQAPDVISPLLPYTLNYTVLWDAGNIGYRHPQFRLTKGLSLGNDMTLELAGAISRTIGDVEGTTLAGEAAGFPTLQGRAGLTFPLLRYKPTTVGISGHWGQEKYPDERIDSWSVNLDVLQPICPVVTIKGELYVGANLDDYFGGIGQGVRLVALDHTTLYENAIADRGGWCAVTLGPWDAFTFNVGAGLDDVDNDDVSTGARTSNWSVFANAVYALNKNVDIGLELSQWRTDYKNADDVDDTRIQGSFIYKF